MIALEKNRWVLLAIAIGVTGSSVASAAVPWWDAQWKARRRIELSGARRIGRAPLVAHFRFRDFGHLKPDASDVRIVSEQGRLVPFRVKFYHPSLYCVAAFEPDDVTWRGYVYYGNPNATRADNPWEPRSGLFLTTYRLKNAGCNNWQQMQETMRLSFQQPEGAGFHPSIFDGYNPFGSNENFVSHYDGYFYAPRKGTYRFATISDDASFVLIDGKLVAQWPGSHPVGGGLRGEHGGTIELEMGAHRVQYYHVQMTATTVAELAWTVPGENRPRVVRPEDFLPVFEAQVGLQEFHNDPATVEFSATPVRTLAYGGHHYILWRFGDLSGVPGSLSVASQWDFGNGLTTTARSPFVWFFHEGDYPVTLRTTLGSGQARTAKQLIRVADLVQLDGSDNLAEFDRAAQMVGEYPIGLLGEEDRQALLGLLALCKRYDAVEKTCRAWLDDTYRKGTQVPVDAVLELGRILSDVRKQYIEAETVYEQAARRIGANHPLGYQVFVALGEIRARHLKKYDEALDALAKAAQRVEAHNEVWRRRIAVALGDAYRAKQDRDLARKHYLEAEKVRPPSEQEAVARSSYGLTVEAYLARSESAEALEKLQEWAERFPSDKLGGYWSLLMGRCLAQMRRYGEAVEELALAAKIEPFGTYTRDVLEQLGQTYRLQKRPSEAIEALRSAASLFDDPGRKRIIEEQIAQIQREASAAR